MTTPARTPGSAAHARARTAFRLLGALLLVVGLLLAITGGMAVAAAADTFPGPSFADFLRLGGGGMLCVLGIGVLGVGFVGAQARYTAAETMPVIRDALAQLSDREGVVGAGRTVDADRPASGPYCSACGVRNDADARFCDSCGTALG